MTTFAAILVVVVVETAGNNPRALFYPASDMAVCQAIVRQAVLLPPGHDDRRGVQAMFCIESQFAPEIKK
jgi:hypothetical protein